MTEGASGKELELNDVLSNSVGLTVKQVTVYHEGDGGQIKRVVSKQLKKKNIRLNYYGPLLDLDLAYRLKNIE